MIRLSVTTNEGRGVFSTQRNEVLVGSREGAGLRIPEPGIAPNHCLLRADGDTLTLVDLGGGVQHAGAPVAKAALRAGSAFRIGSCTVEVERVDGAVSAPPAPPANPVPQGPQPDFARELKKMLAATPWYFISLAVHALVLLVLSLIPYETEEKYRLQNLTAVEVDDPGSIEESPADIEPDLESLEEDEPAEDFEELIEPERKRRKEVPVPMEAQDRPDVTGLGQPNLNTRIKPLSTPTALKLSDGESDVNRGAHAEEQQRAKAIAAKGNERGIRRLKLLPQDRILVVEGEFDEMETILRLYEIPHTVIRREHLTMHGVKRAQVLCLNCGRTPTPLQKGVLVNKVKKFVKDGGWLISSDWALSPYLTEAFPDYVREITPRRRQLDTTVEVRPRAANSPLIEGVFARRMRTRWWLEEASKFVDPRAGKVNVLISSPDMKRRYGSGVVAIEFRPSRKGRVVHLLGHFYQKDGNRAGVVGMHRIILNFLQERFQGDER